MKRVCKVSYRDRTSCRYPTATGRAIDGKGMKEQKRAVGQREQTRVKGARKGGKKLVKGENVQACMWKAKRCCPPR